MAKITFLIGLLLCLGTVKGQGEPDLPCMFLDSVTSKSHVRSFSSEPYGKVTKQQVFDAAYGGAHPKGYICTVGVMDELIRKLKAIDPKVAGFRIYFGAYGGETTGGLGTVMAGVKKNQVILIFAATPGLNEEDYNKYYVISSKGSSVFNVSKSVAQKWVNNYFDSINNVRGLVSTIQIGDSNNLVLHNDILRVSDTKSLYYDTANFSDFMITERLYQNERGRQEGKKNIDTIQIDFAAYPANGIGPNIYGRRHEEFRSRLIVQFEFIRDGRIEYIDPPQEESRRRERKCPLNNAAAIVPLSRFANNGQLCPSQCPPPKTGLD